jgi:hypothetical protein
MPRTSYKRWIIVLVAVVVVAALIRFFAEPLLETFKAMHGGGGGH